MTCLLDFDSSDDVVLGGIYSSLNSDDQSTMLEKIDACLMANPEAVRIAHSHRHNGKLLHTISYRGNSFSSSLCIAFMNRIITIHPDAVNEVNDNGELAVHTAARESTLDAMEFLLGVYPESATIVSTSTWGSGRNLLHHALSMCSLEQFTDLLEKVKYLCSRYPTLLDQRDDQGQTPLNYVLLEWRKRRKCDYYGYAQTMVIPELSYAQTMVIPEPIGALAAMALCAYGGKDLVTESSHNGWLPLHCFVASDALRHFNVPVFAEFFRKLLR